MFLKVILCKYDAFYCRKIALIGFTLRDIKQGIMFLDTLYKNMFTSSKSTGDDVIFRWSLGTK